VTNQTGPMIYESLLLIAKELNQFLNIISGEDEELVVLGNISQLESNLSGNTESNALLNKVVITLINVEEEKALKNTPAYKKTVTETIHANPPLFLNLYVLISATNTAYDNALIYISRVLRFFQGQNVFTHKNAPQNNQPGLGINDFRLIFDLYSPTFEEANFLWSTLGGKQLPSLIYKIRLVMLERTEPAILETSGVITEVQLNEK
jgi:hypothetical protein